MIARTPQVRRRGVGSRISVSRHGLQINAGLPRERGGPSWQTFGWIAFSAFPRAHWTRVWSTNPLERLNKEVKRRARLVGIFPTEASVIRLVGAVLADVHEESASR